MALLENGLVVLAVIATVVRVAMIRPRSRSPKIKQ
jgi:hypothetical protein